MKKFCKLMALVLVMTLLLFTPSTAVAVSSLAKIAPADTSDRFAAPSQSAAPFDFVAVDTYDLANWTKPSGTYLISQQLTAENNNKFYEEHKENTLKDLSGHTPYVIASTTSMPASGGYTTNAITLAANGCYKISVEYCVVKQKDSAVKVGAFGTFYLNDEAITLPENNHVWSTAVFYVRTDQLETATVTPELYFGSRQENALGSIYFDKFTVNAVKQSTFDQDVDDPNRDRSKTYYLNFTNNSAHILEAGDFANEKFTGITTANADYSNSISTAELPTNLGFQSEQPYFYAKDSVTSNVMLLKANKSDVTVTLQDYTFKPRPNEAYMFQFYSIATATDDFSGFYFKIGDDAQQITKVNNYPYHNGWQLNTVFFVAGRDLKQEYTLSFSLGNGGTTTGWACIDDFQIYKVNGSYATNNRAAVGVHNTIDKNDTDTVLDIPNGYFELGTAADNVNKDSSYPYPLVANDWTTNTTTNGIVNLHASLWHDRFGDNPGSINNNSYFDNNHVYMMHNAERTINVLTSPALTTTNDATTYVSFDAYSNLATETRAYILSAETDDDGNMSNEIILGNYIDINDNGWHHYEFNIVEGAYANTRNYYLRFVMKGIGYAYIDNVRTTTDGAFQNASAAQTTSADVDLTNPLAIEDLWQPTDGIKENAWIHKTNDGLKIENVNKQKTVVQNAFAYNLTADDYYEVVISAYGKNAYLGFSSYDGLLEVTTDKLDPEMLSDYKLYIHPSEGATAVNFQVTVGYVGDDTDTAPIADGNIFISSIEINSIDEDDFNNAKENATSDSRLKVLSLAEENDDDNDIVYNEPDNNFFGENWWYLIPTLITAIALLLAIATFLFRKIKFEKHITKKTTSYARDMRMKNQHNKIVAQKAAKVDNVTDEPQSK